MDEKLGPSTMTPSAGRRLEDEMRRGPLERSRSSESERDRVLHMVR